MGIRLITGLKYRTPSILNTYVPHIGYKREQIETYRDVLNQYIDKILKSPIRIGRARNFGQVAQTTNNNINYIGKWAMKHKGDKRNGEHLTPTCTKHEYRPKHTHIKHQRK